MAKKWQPGMTAEQVVDMPGEFVLLGTYRARRRSDGATYKVEVFRCGVYGGSVHFVNDLPKVRNVFREQPLVTLRNAARHWDLVKAFKSVAFIGDLHEIDDFLTPA